MSFDSALPPGHFAGRDMEIEKALRTAQHGT